ncbi:App1 family protein [Alienimonas sp. DA493]|uniref:App1 family protein n=1 Tax=Alienimonas sp. DA493 TaxID=3373605 RepID=UPI003754AAEB
MPSGSLPSADQLKHAAQVIEGRYDLLKRNLKAAVGFRRPLKIQTYRGFGSPRDVRVSGRVLEDKPIADPAEDDPWWRNLTAMYHHWQTDEVSGCRVACEFAGHRQTAVSDPEGYFEFRFRPTEPLPAGAFHTATLSLPPQAIRQAGPVFATAFNLVPAADAGFGIISDMDDTVIRSYASNFWKIARLTLLKNARTRLPFEGVSAFYNALAAGPKGDWSRSPASLEPGDDPVAPPNPIYYVSSSAWNLYELFRVFLRVNGLPDGPILLRDMGVDTNKFVAGGHDHKLEKIERIMNSTGDLPFVLIGDSGQDDPKLYRDAVREYPGRVKAVYIRDVRDRTRFDVRRIAREVSDEGVPMVLVPDTVAAANHAADLGLINKAYLPAIREDRRGDRLDATGHAVERQETV